MAKENIPTDPEMARDLVQAQIFDLLRDQANVNAQLLHSITRLALHISLPDDGFNALTRLLSDALELMKQQATKIADTEDLLRKLHDIPGEQLNGE